MLKKYKAAIFDVDGTLLDTTEGILSAVKYTIREKGLPLLADEQFIQFIGPPIQESFRKFYGVSGEAVQELATVFRNRYKDFDLLKAFPYEGIYSLCDELINRNVRIAVATYKRQDYAEKILKHFRFDKYTRILYGSDHENKLKKVDIIRKCLEDLGNVNYSEAVMIGDSSYDAIGAKQIGIDFLGVTYGFEFCKESDVMEFQSVGSVDTPLELLSYF